MLRQSLLVFFFFFSSGRWRFRSQSTGCFVSNHNDSIGQQRNCETVVVRLIFLVVRFLLCHLDVNLMLLANDLLCLNINQRNVFLCLSPEGNLQDICFLVMAQFLLDELDY